MSRFINGIVFVLVICSLRFSAGYKWITLNTNDSIPKNAIKLGYNPTRYVGRAIQYNLVLPAEVHNATYAEIFFQKNVRVKRQFEILIATERCEWIEIGDMARISQNVVRGGSDWNGEPTYIGKTLLYESEHVMSILFASKRFDQWESFQWMYALICDDNTTWVDATPNSVPKNAVASLDTYVARLPGPDSYIPGMVSPSQNTTQAVFKSYTIKSFYCQVLINDQYSWLSVSGIQVPDYAVIGGRSEDGEMRYIARQKNLLTYIVASEIPPSGWTGDILVKNVT